jgi:hypothetical protein
MKQCKIVNGGDLTHIKVAEKKSIVAWIRKQKEICLRKITELEADRLRASTQNNINTFFDIYENDLEKFRYNKSLIVCSFF